MPKYDKKELAQEFVENLDEYGSTLTAAEEMQREIQGTVEDSEMTDEELQGIVDSEISDAINFIDEEIGEQRAMATEYYLGQPFGDEEEGRSTVVSMDVRDTVQAILPSLMRIFFGPQRIVEFVPQGPEDAAAAEQATDYVDFIVKRDNPGFNVLYSAIKDALVRKTGVIKYWWSDDVRVKAESFTNVTEDQMVLLTNDPDVEISAVSEVTDQSFLQKIAQIAGMGQRYFNVDIKRRIRSGRVRIEALPPEEFLIDRRAKSIDDATFVGHRCMKTVSELVAMGYDYDLVSKYAGQAYDFDTNEEYQARNPGAILRGAVNTDPTTSYVLYVEGYLKVDYDGDGIAELRRICTIGNAHEVVMNEVVDERPFCDLCPDPEPHTFFGLSIADVTMDIQRIKSSILRNMLDSLAQSIHPRTAVVEGQANIDDVLNNEVGAIIRMRAPGMVQPFATPFVGKEAFPMMEYMDDVKQNRTGISKAAAGLDADALQSTTKAAVSATVNAAHQHIEMIARIFAETGLRRMFRGILKLTIENQDVPRMVRLRNTYVQVDPRSWDANMDVTVNLALGESTQEEKIQVLASVAQKQEQILQQLGAANDLVTLGQYRNTLAKMLELSGFKDANQFFNPLPLDFKPQPQQPKPSPEEILAQVQAQAIQADIQKKAAELQIQQDDIRRRDDRERDKMEVDALMKKYELELKYSTQLGTEEINAAMNRDREMIRQEGAIQAAAAQAAVRSATAPQTPPVPQPPVA